MCVCARAHVLCVCVCARACAWVGTCAGGVRFSNRNRIIPSDYRILLLLKMPIPNLYIYIYVYYVNKLILDAINRLTALVKSSVFIQNKYSGIWLPSSYAKIICFSNVVLYL